MTSVSPSRADHGRGPAHHRQKGSGRSTRGRSGRAAPRQMSASRLVAQPRPRLLADGTIVPFSTIDRAEAVRCAAAPGRRRNGGIDATACWTSPGAARRGQHMCSGLYVSINRGARSRGCSCRISVFRDQRLQPQYHLGRRRGLGASKFRRNDYGPRRIRTDYPPRRSASRRDGADHCGVWWRRQRAHQRAVVRNGSSWVASRRSVSRHGSPWTL